MIVSDHFIYVHVSRHAGTFINRLLLDSVPGAAIFRYHGQLKNLPEKYKHLPVIGFTRNPWDWYVSMYFNYKAKQQYIFQVISESGTLNFTDTVQRFLNLGDNSPINKNLLKKLQELAPTTGLENLHPKLIRPGLIKEHFREYPPNIGYYSWLLKESHEINGKLIGEFGRFENLREDLLSLLEKTNTPITNQMIRYINGMQPINTSERNKKYESYFSNELKNLVYEKDHFIIDKFSYHF